MAQLDSHADAKLPFPSGSPAAFDTNRNLGEGPLVDPLNIRRRVMLFDASAILDKGRITTDLYSMSA